jgi:AraC family transcriptional regulator, regulatory protein of adaptative response / DNA-3-methyladenine glycosylase II
MIGVYDFETSYRAMASRDQRFDGRFVVAVTSTGVYCRPSCPSRTPLRPNVRFFRLPAAAEAAGFRACRRCRPGAQPSSPEWSVRGDLVARALRLIAAGTVDEEGVTGLARQLAVSNRHLHRRLIEELGVGPQALAISRRAQVARLLIESTALPMADVAFAAGYASVRQFNDGVRAAFGCPPGQLRRGGSGDAGAGPLVLRLPYRPPLPTGPLLAWFAARALPGVEAVDGGGYHRTLRLPHGRGYVDLRAGPATAVTVRLSLTDLRDVTAAVQRCRELFDLDADPAMIDDALLADPTIAPLVRGAPGLRVPGCVDGFELAVRTILGGRCGSLVAAFGEPVETTDGRLTHLFPTAEALLDAPLGTVRALAIAVHKGELTLDRGADREECVAALLRIPGIGPVTAARIAMHALGDPDVFPHTDPALRAAARRLGLDDTPDRLAAYALRWRPWRSYAAALLWSTHTH